MTIPGAIAEQPAMPSRVAVERTRGAGPQKEAKAQPDETQEGFSDVLTKLEGGDEQPAEEAAVGNDDRADMRRMVHRDIRVHIGRGKSEDETETETETETHKGGKGVGVDDPLLGADTPTDATPEAPQADAHAADPRQADAKSASVIAAVLDLAPAKSAGAGEAVAAGAQGAPQHSVQGTDPAVARRAVVDGSVRAGEVAPALPSGRALKGQQDQNSTSSAPVSEPDFALASDAAAEPAAMSARTPPHTEKAKVLAQETHFAPVAPTSAAVHARAASAESTHGTRSSEAARGEPAATAATTMPTVEPPAATVPSPTQQIADRIKQEVPAFAPASNPGAGPEQPSSAPVLKVLQIQLQPADLGTVTVRIELKDSGIKLHVEADRPETAEILRSDQDTLSKLLRSAGYSVDAGAIRVVDGDRSVTPAQAGQQGAQANLQSSTQSHQSQHGFSERQDRPQRGGATADGGEAKSTTTNRTDTNETTTGRTGRDLYV